MTLFEWCNTNAEQVAKLERMGIIKYKVSFYYAVYAKFLYFVPLCKSKNEAVLQTASNLFTTKANVYCIIKEMSKEI